MASFFAIHAFGAHVGDFDGDGTDDVLLWIEDSWHVLEMDGLGVAGGETLAPDLSRDVDWRVVGIGDLNGDGNDDVLLRHVDGSWYYHAMDGRQTFSAESGHPGLPDDPEWEFAGIGDLNGDGRADVLLRHENGRWVHFAMDGRRRVSAGRGVTLPRDLAWRLAGIGDLNGDGADDMLLRHVDGRWFYHAMRDGRSSRGLSGFADLPHDPDRGVAGLGDLNGDGNDDVLMRDSNGRWFYYAMDGRDVIESASGRANLASGHRWRLAGIGDLDGDGNDDVLLHSSDDQWFLYAMDGWQSIARRSGEADLPATGTVRACGDDRANPSYVGYVTGFAGTRNELEAVLTGSGTLQVVQPDSAGCFTFDGVPSGRHAIKVNARGHRTTPARIVQFPFEDVHDGKAHAVQLLPTDPFTYHWEEDQTTAGAEYSSHVVQPPIVEFHGSAVEVADAAAAERLRQDYNILLVDEGWSQEHAYRLLETMRAIPQLIQQPEHDRTLPASAWRLTDDFIDDDISTSVADDGTREVTISSAAFVNASPRIATIDGRRGVWFSRRLHHAAVRFVTDDGRDQKAYERIFTERYGLTTVVEDYPALTGPTGNESHHNFQSFHADEILLLINMLEEMPVGMHKVGGMRHLVRRLNGLVHPIHPTAPAVAWPQSEYVEFMESAFKEQSEDYMHRLIIHEKAHFLWTHLFDEQLKADWIDLGGWYRDPDAASGWSTTKTAEFVSAYAHLKDPNEDLAETISYFVINPDRLKARSMAKYEFVRDRIMQGNTYVARIREDLTFEVYNLFPDYVYPGKVRSVDITVAGSPSEDKVFTVNIELHSLDAEAEGAKEGFVRIFSEVGTYIEPYLRPVDDLGNRLSTGETGTRLRGEVTLSKYAKAGFWLPNQILIRDEAGNDRYQRTSDFGWSMYVDNDLEDYTPPEYVPWSLTMGSSVWATDSTVQVIHVAWLVNEDTGMSNCHVRMSSGVPGTYTHDRYGDPSPAGDECNVDFLMPSYMPSSTYSVRSVFMDDVARNRRWVKFTGGDTDEPSPTIELVTANPDVEPPEIDVNRISVSATPTDPDAPNGETEVTVSFLHRDNISGLGRASLRLRDPQGGTHFHWIWDGSSARTLYPREDPAVWRDLERVVTLPPGSLPGTWGVAEIEVQDRATNRGVYNFVEIVHFEVEGG